METLLEPETKRPAVSAPRRDYAYYRNLIKGRRMPCAFVDLDLYDANVAQVLKRTGGKKMRIASKSIRCRALMDRIFQTSASFQGIMCYSGWEAAYLAQKGYDDLLVAYPIWQDAQVEAVCAEIARGKTISIMLDSPEHAVQFGRVAARAGVRLPVSIDLDMSSDFDWLKLHFGVRRSPITSAEQVVRVVEAIEKQPSLLLDGIMGYEAQIAGVQDNVPGAAVKNQLVRYLKKKSIQEITARRAAVVAAIEARGHKLRIVNGGGTGSLESTREESCVTEVTAGSAFYSPAIFDGYVNFKHLPAAGFAVEITRIPVPETYTCHGAGYVASGSAGKEKLPRPYLPEGCRLIDNEGTGEVQTPVLYSGPEKLSHGDPIFFRHSKAGELCEHFNTLLLISNGEIKDEVTTYRGEGQCFIG